MRRLVTFKELRSIYGISISAQHCLRMQKTGRFPLRRKWGGGNLNTWYADEIETWLSQLTVQTPRPE
jgi:predicted DNA-binding transcriptional regulator AlpA